MVCCLKCRRTDLEHKRQKPKEFDRDESGMDNRKRKVLAKIQNEK